MPVTLHHQRRPRRPRATCDMIRWHAFALSPKRMQPTMYAHYMAVVHSRALEHTCVCVYVPQIVFVSIAILPCTLAAAPHSLSTADPINRMRNCVFRGWGCGREEYPPPRPFSAPLLVSAQNWRMRCAHINRGGRGVRTRDRSTRVRVITPEHAQECECEVSFTECEVHSIYFVCVRLGRLQNLCDVVGRIDADISLLALWLIRIAVWNGVRHWTDSCMRAMTMLRIIGDCGGESDFVHH